MPWNLVKVDDAEADENSLTDAELLSVISTHKTMFDILEAKDSFFEEINKKLTKAVKKQNAEKSP